MELVDWSEWSETIQAAELQYLRMLKLLLQFRHCSLEKYGHAWLWNSKDGLVMLKSLGSILSQSTAALHRMS